MSSNWFEPGLRMRGFVRRVSEWTKSRSAAPFGHKRATIGWMIGITLDV